MFDVWKKLADSKQDGYGSQKRGMLTSIAVVLALAGFCFLPGAAQSEGTNPNCPSATFNFPIGDPEPTISITVGNFGKIPVLVDTGMSFNSVLVNIDRYKGPTTFGNWGDVSLPDLGETLQFKAVPVPRSFLQSYAAKNISSFILNPRLAYPNGYIVVDLKRRRFLGFKEEADLRNCYGYGHRSNIRPIEEVANIPFIDATVDGKFEGRFSIDTGTYLTLFYAPQLADRNAVPAPKYAYTRLTGHVIIPRISSDHVLQIGSVNIKLSEAAISTVTKPNFPSGTLGMDILKNCVLIFPPSSKHYWELIY